MSTQETKNNFSDLADRKSAATSTFVDRVVTVSSSALAFSMTFRSSLIGSSPEHLWLLKLAWIGFGLCSIIGVTMHLASVSALKRAIIALRDSEGHGVSASAHGFYEFIYRIMVLAFPVSIIAMMAFGVLNTH